MRRRLEFMLVWTAVKLLSLPPRGVARGIGALIGRVALLLTPRLTRAGDLNLRLAFPQKSKAERRQILRKLYRNLGWLLAEFCQMPRYTRETTRSFIRYDGLDHYLAARDEGKGVLILTGHLGAWELVEFLSLTDGLPHEHRDPPAGQSVGRQPGQSHSLPAWQSSAAQGRLCARSAGLHATG